MSWGHRLTNGWLTGESAPTGPLVNQRTGTVLATNIAVAADRITRRRGLLDRDHLAEHEALILVPCFAIHTWRMRFPIDVLFLDGTGRVIAARSNVLPGRIATAPRARAVIELAAGRIAATGTGRGDEIGRLR
jgi:uncharacterized protein